MSWREFIRSHLEVLAAVDFFTAEVWTAGGWMTYYVLTFMRVGSRQVCRAGITTSPDQDRALVLSIRQGHCPNRYSAGRQLGWSSPRSFRHG